MKPINKPYVIKDDYSFPFSRGILTQSLVNAGLDTDEAYETATEIQQILVDKNVHEIEGEDLKNLVITHIIKKYDKTVKEGYLKANAIRVYIVQGTSETPYSKGIMSQSLKASGLEPSLSYEIAKRIETYLFNHGKYKITNDELRSVTCDILEKLCGKEYGERYLIWRSIKNPSKPFILLFGGGTGSGKSTISSEIAYRLGITSVLSTDSIREVMRSMISKELIPSLHLSSFAAWKSYDASIAGSSDPVIVAFLEQSARIAVGVTAVIDRAIKENVSIVINGIHLVPGLMKKSYFEEANLAFMVITTSDKNLHKSRFDIRDKTSKRKVKSYLDNFEHIRKLQNYIILQAENNGIPVIDNIDLDETISGVLDHLTEFMKEKLSTDVE